MPCTYYSAEDEKYIANQQVNLLTKLLCKTCELLEANKIELPNELAVWWTDHQERDKARIKAEQELIARQKEQDKLKTQALSKLSEQEKKALGIR